MKSKAVFTKLHVYVFLIAIFGKFITVNMLHVYRFIMKTGYSFYSNRAHYNACKPPITGMLTPIAGS